MYLDIVMLCYVTIDPFAHPNAPTVSVNAAVRSMECSA